MKKIVVVIPHSHSWFWTQTCISSLLRNPPRATNCFVKIIVVDNSPWSPAINGITKTALFNILNLYIQDNYKTNKFHASALDCVVEQEDFDYLIALETDVLVCRSNWLQWFVDQLKPTDYAVGMWHHEQFVNPSCTLYRGSVLKQMAQWCRNHPSPDELRWGHHFSKFAPLDDNLKLAENPELILKDMKGWIGGPFAEKRGWPEGTVLKEQPSGQLKGSGWYEPGQQLHHWAVDNGYTYTVCPTTTTNREGDNLPLQSLYGEGIPNHSRQLEAVELFGNCYAAHMWGGTRALDIIKHDVTCQFVKNNTPYWLSREARYWKHVVPQGVQEETLELIRKLGWYYRGQGSDIITERDREAAEFVKQCYELGGVTW